MIFIDANKKKKLILLSAFWPLLKTSTHWASVVINLVKLEKKINNLSYS